MRTKLWIAVVVAVATSAGAADTGLAAPSKAGRLFTGVPRAPLRSLQELHGAPMLVQLARGRQAAAARFDLRRAGARLVSETLSMGRASVGRAACRCAADSAGRDPRGRT